MEASYWRINDFRYNDLDDTASVSLWLYGSEESKKEDLKNGLIREVINLDKISEVVIPEELASLTNPRDLLKSMLYAKIKESKMVEVSPAVEAKEAVLDEEGNIVEEAVAAQDAVLEESNWFADSIDC